MIINNREISTSSAPYIIAELSANHNGDIQRAFDSILAAKEAGADAVKIQTYTADTMTIDCDREDFQITGGLWDGYNLYELYKEAQTPYEWHQPLFDYAKEIGITIFSSPFDETAVDLLEDLDAPAYKIASFEMTDLPLVKYVAKTGKPMIVSTGMASLEEIEEVVKVAKDNGCQDLILLHCVSAYPAPVDQVNLATIVDFSKRFDTPIGLSDHTMGTVVATTSVALGACLIEKHFTLSRADKGPDSEFSLEPCELKKLCRDTRIAWQSLGSVNYDRKASEGENVRFRRSIYAIKDIQKGESFSEKNVKRIRPGFGLNPKYWDELLSSKASCNIARGEPISLDLML